MKKFLIENNPQRRKGINSRRHPGYVGRADEQLYKDYRIKAKKVQMTPEEKNMKIENARQTVALAIMNDENNILKKYRPSLIRLGLILSKKRLQNLKTTYDIPTVQNLEYDQTDRSNQVEQSSGRLNQNSSRQISARNNEIKETQAAPIVPYFPPYTLKINIKEIHKVLFMAAEIYN